MSNEIQIFSNKEMNNLKMYRNTNWYSGFFYIVEYGQYIKIGSSIYPYGRIKTFMREANYNDNKIGRVAISPEHTNFRENERVLHEAFSDVRKAGTELFNKDFDAAIKEALEFVTYNKDEISSEMDDSLRELLEKSLHSDREDRIISYLFPLVSIYPYIFNKEPSIDAIKAALRDASDVNENLENILFECGLDAISPYIKRLIETEELAS